MKDLTVIVPVHEYKDEYEPYLNKAIESATEAARNYGDNGKVSIRVIFPNKEVRGQYDKLEKSILEGAGVSYDVAFVNPTKSIKSDFCSMINWAVDEGKVVTTPHFSVLELDDEYTPKWFVFAKEYYDFHQDAALVLPMEILLTEDKEVIGLCNELAWSMGFSDELGFINNNSLQDCSPFNVTGGIFNTEDFKSVGKYKPSIEVAFQYELLCRITHLKLKLYVVPRIGYYHIVGREGSLREINAKLYNEQEIARWHDIARTESAFTNERAIDKKKLLHGISDLK